jgi:fructoselysine 6-kinase
VVVTLGERGSVAATTEEAIAVDATPTTIVRDTCGAGDAFIAAFLAARLAGTPLRGCLDDGASAGAQVCSLLGAFPQQGVTALTTT